MEHTGPQFPPIKAEDPGTQDPHIQAVAESHGDGRSDLLHLFFCLGLGYGWQKEDRDGKEHTKHTDIN